jgi:hypothetical protein
VTSLAASDSRCSSGATGHARPVFAKLPPAEAGRLALDESRGRVVGGENVLEAAFPASMPVGTPRGTGAPCPARIVILATTSLAAITTPGLRRAFSPIDQGDFKAESFS